MKFHTDEGGVANALEESANAYVPLRKVSARQLTDPKDIKALMMKSEYLVQDSSDEIGEADLGTAVSDFSYPRNMDIVHVEIPIDVRNAFNELCKEYTGQVREANPLYDSK